MFLTTTAIVLSTLAQDCDLSHPSIPIEDPSVPPAVASCLWQCWQDYLANYDSCVQNQQMPCSWKQGCIASMWAAWMLCRDGCLLGVGDGMADVDFTNLWLMADPATDLNGDGHHTFADLRLAGIAL